MFVEPSVQAWASGSHVVMGCSSWLYVNAQTTVTVGALLYLYLRHNRYFYFVRNMFMIAMAIALVGYIVFPTAPPRFMPEWGFIDSVSDFTGVHVSHASASMNALFNPYAAVPSMHVAFALMIGWPLARLVAPAGGARAVAAVSVPDGVRDRRHRQPLHRRRAARGADRRASRPTARAGSRARDQACMALLAPSRSRQRRYASELMAPRHQCTPPRRRGRRSALPIRARRTRAGADRCRASGASWCATG